MGRGLAYLPWTAGGTRSYSSSRAPTVLYFTVLYRSCYLQRAPTARREYRASLAHPLPSSVRSASSTAHRRPLRTAEALRRSPRWRRRAAPPATSARNHPPLTRRARARARGQPPQNVRGTQMSGGPRRLLPPPPRPPVVGPSSATGRRSDQEAPGEGHLDAESGARQSPGRSRRRRRRRRTARSARRAARRSPSSLSTRTAAARGRGCGSSARASARRRR